jgi:hypothetical protein
VRILIALIVVVLVGDDELAKGLAQRLSSLGLR